MSSNAITRPFLPPLNELLPYLQDIWKRKCITNNGYYHKKLEQALCLYLGVPYISLCSSGTTALTIAIKALDLKGEVITTPFSFIATAHALLWNGLTPVFSDIDPETGNLDPSKIEAAITSQTTAILPVHIYGNPCDEEKIKKIAVENNLKILYDAAHAFGVTKNKSSILNFGDLSVVSFHATKIFSTIEGGAIICHDKKMKDKIDGLKNFGYDDEANILSVGINGKLNEVQAAFGLLSLAYTDDIINKRRTIAGMYQNRLANERGIRLIKIPENIFHNYTYFPILIDKREYGLSRDEVFEKLVSKGIGVKKYFSPLISTISMYQRLPSAAKSNLREAHRFAAQVLCLPMHHELSEIDVINIINALK